MCAWSTATTTWNHSSLRIHPCASCRTRTRVVVKRLSDSGVGPTPEEVAIMNPSVAAFAQSETERTIKPPAASTPTATESRALLLYSTESHALYMINF
jgi:hypothetical protein